MLTARFQFQLNDANFTNRNQLFYFLQFNIEFHQFEIEIFERKTMKCRTTKYFYTFRSIRQIWKSDFIQRMFTKIIALSKWLAFVQTKRNAWKRQLLPFGNNDVFWIRCTDCTLLLFRVVLVFYAFDAIRMIRDLIITYMLFTWHSTWIEMHTLHAEDTERSDIS